MILSEDKKSAPVTIDLSASTVTLRQDGIMHIDIKASNDFMVNDVHEILNAMQEIGGEKKFLNMITIKQYVTIHKEARALSASEAGNRQTIADAIVVNSIALKLVLNLYLSFDKPVRPTRGFTSEEKAIEWLNTFF